MPDWYPKRDAELIPWHANFAARVAESGASFGLTAGQIAQAGADAQAVRSVVVAMAEATAYHGALAAYKRLILVGSRTAPLPAAPTPPALLTPAAGTLPGVEERTRRLAKQLRASAAFSPDDGELFGITAPEKRPPGKPSVEAFALAGGSVRLRIAKAGHRALMVDSRRAGGVWEQIGVSMRAEYIDKRPAAAAHPELREYRVQGYARNARVGEYSDSATAVTLP